MVNRATQTTSTATTAYFNRYWDKNLTTGDVTLYYYFGGRLVAFKKGSTLEYVHQDHLGGTVATTDSSGAVKSTTAYFPFGATRSSSGTLDTSREFTG
ncbi:MAG: hypothetical protein HY261_08875, partial [Chloroflexi bacterium]|nr:hypothetical protein [Chloroflexota bacterium]